MLVTDRANDRLTDRHLGQIAAEIEQIIFPAFAVTETQASLLRQGQTVEVPETSNGTVQVRHDRNLVALGEVEEGILRPVRVFNLMEK